MVEIIFEAIDALIPWASNARTHSPEQVAQIAASIREFGFTTPVLLRDDKTIIAGHGRVLAARKLGLVDIPCIYLSHLTAAQARAYVLADNQLATHAGWDADMLQAELDILAEFGVDPALLGFTPQDLDGIFGVQVNDELHEAEDETGSLEERYMIIVDCANEDEQRELVEDFIKRGIKCRALVS